MAKKKTLLPVASFYLHANIFWDGKNYVWSFQFETSQDTMQKIADALRIVEDNRPTEHIGGAK